MQFITGQKLALHQLLQTETQFKVRVQFKHLLKSIFQVLVLRQTINFSMMII
jgi:hypothetical protein